MPPRRLDDWLRWIERLHPREIDPGLDRVRRVGAALGVDRARCPVITVAGTNGKGSCIAMLEAALAAGGYRVAAYTSPHLRAFNERIRIAGRDATDEALCAAFERVERARGDLTLSYFEFGTLAAFDLFARAGPDVILLEVGMGGRLDAVNAVDCDLAIVTSIGIDHVQWLGPDRESIGREKAGIFRPGRPAVCADPDPPASLVSTAAGLGAPLFVYGRDFSAAPVPDGDGWVWTGPDDRRMRMPALALSGDFQLRTAAAVATALDRLSALLPAAPDRIAAGLARARLPGRFEWRDGAVPLVLDVAHNVDAARALAGQLAARPVAGATRMVFGVLADKDIEGMVTALDAVVDAWYVAAPAAARAAAADEVARRIAGLSQAPVSACAAVEEAVRRATGEAAPGDRVVVCGSFYTVAEACATAAVPAESI